MTRPDPNKIHPIEGYDKEIYVIPILTNSNLEEVKEEVRRQINER